MRIAFLVICLKILLQNVPSINAQRTSNIRPFLAVQGCKTKLYCGPFKKETCSKFIKRCYCNSAILFKNYNHGVPCSSAFLIPGNSICRPKTCPSKKRSPPPRRKRPPPPKKKKPPPPKKKRPPPPKRRRPPAKRLC